jgi:hypothetical protein
MSAQVPGLLYRLEYELVTDGWEITFAYPPRVAVTQPEFEITLEDGRATVEMLVRYPGEAGARRVVEPFLRGWEIAALLDAGVGDFRFEFRAAAVSGRETSTWQRARQPGRRRGSYRQAARACILPACIGWVRRRRARRAHVAPLAPVP